MSEDLSQGTFDLIWEDLFDPQEENSQSQDNVTAVTELTSTDFLQEQGFDIEMLFDEIHEPSYPSPPENPSTCPGPCPTNMQVEPAPVMVDSPSNNDTIKANEQPNLPNTDTSPEEMDISTLTTTDPEFIAITNENVHKMIENEENKNTLKKTLSDIAKFQRFLTNKQETRAIHEIEHELLDEYIVNFILSVRKTNGDEYEPSSIKNMICSIDRKLRRQKYPHKIFSDQSNVFQLSRDALTAKQKSLKRLGKGNRPNKSSPISDHEINMLYEKGVLGGGDAKSLLNTIWFNNCVLFGLRGTKENYDLRWGDVQLKTGSDGIQYLELQERQTKTRTGTNISDVREVMPKIYATPDDPERCPVEMFKLYASKRPSDFCQPEHPFYISPRTSSQKFDSKTWFMKTRIGEKKLGGLLKVMAKEGGLDMNKRLTNHSTRKHLVQKLRDSGIAETDIMQISGHKNVQSVLNYSAMSEEKHKQCSKILSSVRSNNSKPSSTAICPAVSKSNHVQSNSTCTQAAPCSNNTAAGRECAPEPQIYENSENNLPPLPHPHNLMQEQSMSSHSGGNSISVSNDNLTLNTQMNSLFSGAVLNIQNFNVYMK